MRLSIGWGWTRLMLVLAIVLAGVSACSGGDAEAPSALPVFRTEGLVCSDGAQGAWCWVQPRPRGNGIHDAAFVDALRGWVVGEAGLILHTVDGGSSWVQQNSGTRHGLHQVRFLDARVGFAAGQGGTVLRTVDGGAHWTRWPLDAWVNDLYITRLEPVSDREVVVAGSSGNAAERLLRLRDARQVASTGVDLQSLSVSAGGWASWNVDGELYVEPHRSGDTWVRYTPDDGRMVKASGVVGTNVFWALVGRRPFAEAANGIPEVEPNPDVDPVLVHSEDGGATWHATPVELPAGQGGLLLWSARIFGSGAGWAWAASGSLLRTEDGGRRWTLAASIAPGADRPGYWWGRQSWFIDAETVQVSAGDQTWITLDAARSWRVPAPYQPASAWPGKYLQSLADRFRRDGAGGLLAIEASGITPQRLFRSLDGGITWRALGGIGSSGPALRDVGSVLFQTPLQGLMAQGSLLRRTNDGGASWQDVQEPDLGDCPDCQALLLRPRDGSLWRTRGRHLARSTDHGSSWVSVPLPALLQYPYYISITNAQVLWAQAAGGLFRSLDGGVQWHLMPVTPELVANGVTRLAFADAQVGVLISGRGEIWRSADGGAQWQRVPAELALPRSGRIIWTDARQGWVLGGTGEVLRSTDAGLSWQAVNLPTRLRMNDLQFASAQRGWMVGEAGVILATDDGGRRWTLQPSGTEQQLNAVWALDPANVWVSGSGGTLLTSATGGW